MLSVLVVDDEVNIRRTLSRCLAEEGHSVTTAPSARDAMAAMESHAFDLIFLDLRLGHEDGMQLIGPLLAASPRVKIAIITAHATIESAVDAVRRGAADYLPKPFTVDQVRLLTARIARIVALEREVDALRRAQRSTGPPEILESSDPKMRLILETAQTVAASDAIVLLLGESGTGKTVLARVIHSASRRSGKPFAAVSCPAIPHDLLESELFGHARGAFTGAVREHAGRIASCEGGTLFLDEIGDMPPTVQAKILRFLQDREYERLGDSVTRRADVRVIAATNADLVRRVEDGRFREDLYYRLNVVTVTIPPLRARPVDIVPLAKTYLDWFSRTNNRIFEGFSPEAEAALIAHAWSGNIRELRNAIERATILARGPRIDAADLPGCACASRSPALGDPVSISVIEERHIRLVLSVSPTLQAAADTLGIDQATLWRKRKQYGI